MNDIDLIIGSVEDQIAELWTQANQNYWRFVTAKIGWEGYEAARKALQVKLEDPQLVRPLVELRAAGGLGPIQLSGLQKTVVEGWTGALGHDEESDPDSVALNKALLPLLGLTFNPPGWRLQYPTQRFSLAEAWRILHVSEDRELRREAFDRLILIGQEYLAHGMEELIRQRNLYARKKGFANYYQYQLSRHHMRDEDLLKITNELFRLTKAPAKAMVEEYQGGERLRPWDVFAVMYSPYQLIQPYLGRDHLEAAIAGTLAAMGLQQDRCQIHFEFLSDENEFGGAFTAPVRLFNPHHPEQQGDVRILSGRGRDGYFSYYTTFHELGHAVHLSHVHQDYLYFRSFGDYTFTEGIAEFFGKLVADPQWLQQFARDDNKRPIPTATLTEFARLLKLKQAFRARYYLTLFKFERLLYLDLPKSINELWWDLMAQFLAVQGDRTQPGWAYVNHWVSHPIYQHQYLFAYAMREQIYRFVTGTFKSAYRNRRIGPYLIDKGLKFGGRATWCELIENLTGEPLRWEYYHRYLALS